MSKESDSIRREGEIVLCDKDDKQATTIEIDECKLKAFEYVLYQLKKWYQLAFPKSKSNDISVLKAMKLLFFVANIKTLDDNKTPSDLLEFFNNFQAWKYGHVEADVYNSFRKSDNISLDRHELAIKSEINIQKWAKQHHDLAKKIDNSIDTLRRENFDLIRKEAFSLVDISHSYLSWIYYHQYLKEYTQTIPVIEIRNEEKYYS